MKIEKPHMIIGIVIIALAIGVFYTMEEPAESNLTVAIDGMCVEEDTYALQVFGSLRDADYVSSKNAYVVLQGQSVLIETGVYNPASSFAGAWYRTGVHTEGQNLVMSTAVFLEPDGIKESTLSYQMPYNTGRYEVCVESEVRTNEYDVWWFDDIDCFTVEVVSPNPCIGITCNDYCSGTTLYDNGVCVNGICEYDIRIKAQACGYIEPTPTPTPTPTPDPCTGITCDPYCEGTTYNYNGYCDNGQCQYQTEYNSAECGYVGPTPTPTPTPTETPPPTNDEGDLTGILWWGGGIIGTMAILLFALKAKR